MLYIKKTFSYLKKSFWLLALIAAVPAVLTAVFFRPLGFIGFIPQYAHFGAHSFTDIAWMIFDRYSFTYVYPIVLTFIALVLSFSLSLSVIEKHFKVGRLLLKAPVKDVNNSLFPVLKTLTVITVFYLAWNFMLAGIITLAHFIFSGPGVPTKLNLIIANVLVLGLFVLFVFFSTPSVLWAPLMLLFGYSFVDAFVASTKLTGKATGRLFFGVLFPFVVIILLQYVLSFFFVPLIIMKVISGFYILFLIVYLMAYMMVAAFDLTDMERRDIKKSYV